MQGRPAGSGARRARVHARGHGARCGPGPGGGAPAAREPGRPPGAPGRRAGEHARGRRSGREPAEHRRADDRRPDRRVDARAAEGEGAAAGARGHVLELLRELSAVLPVPRDVLHRPVRPQPSCRSTTMGSTGGFHVFRGQDTTVPGRAATTRGTTRSTSASTSTGTASTRARLTARAAGLERLERVGRPVDVPVLRLHLNENGHLAPLRHARVPDRRVHAAWPSTRSIRKRCGRVRSCSTSRSSHRTRSSARRRASTPIDQVGRRQPHACATASAMPSRPTRPPSLRATRGCRGCELRSTSTTCRDKPENIQARHRFDWAEVAEIQHRLPAPPRGVALGRRRGPEDRRRAAPDGAARQHRHLLRLGQRVLPRRAPRAVRQVSAVRAVDPRAPRGPRARPRAGRRHAHAREQRRPRPDDPPARGGDPAAHARRALAPARPARSRLPRSTTTPSSSSRGRTTSAHRCTRGCEPSGTSTSSTPTASASSTT